jgi:hypothetical protein
MSKIYYADKTRVSNSSIGYFLVSPKNYFTVLNFKESIDTTYMAFGRALHAYILEREEFNKIYRVRDFEIPINKQQKDFCAYVISKKGSTNGLSSLKKMLVKAYKKAYSTDGKSEKVLEKASLDLAIKFKIYIQQHTDSERIYITWNQFNKIRELNKLAYMHKFAKNLLIEPGRCEFHIDWHYAGVDCKSLIDKCIIDEENKRIVLIDLKSTASIADFKSSVSKYGYRRQMMFYRLAINHYIRTILLDKFTDYSFECYIVALQTTENPLVEVFSFSKEELNKELPIIADSLTRIKWHSELGEWEHSKEYYEGNGVIEMTLD